MLLVAGGVTLHHYHLKGAVERYKIALSRKGEPVEWTDIQIPHPERELNSAALVLEL